MVKHERLSNIGMSFRNCSATQDIMNRSPLTMAIAQSQVVRDVRTNGIHIRTLMEQARDRGARLVHFPEGALSGYVKAQIANWSEVDWTIVRSELIAVQKAAHRLNMWVVVGCNHRLTTPNRPHNSLFIISDSGQIIDRYDKRYCSNSEITDWYAPGSDACVFEVDGFRFGCALCIEIQFLEVFAEYERLNADCVLFSCYGDDPMFWTMSQGYAAANNYWVSVSTPAQCSAGLPSGIIGPNGQGLMRGNANNLPELLIVTLDPADPKMEIALSKARPWRRRARTGEIYGTRPINDPRSRNRLEI